jgi:hypothetical protein
MEQTFFTDEDSTLWEWGDLPRKSSIDLPADGLPSTDKTQLVRSGHKLGKVIL